MRFTRARSVVILGGLVLSGCGTVLPAPAPDESVPEHSTEATEPTPASVATDAPPTADLASTTVDVGADGGSADAAPGKANGEDCSSNVECASGTCLLTGKTHYCTIPCAEPDEKDEACEALGAPFSGECNKEGFCKR